jgi:hypothetical protein
VPAVGRVRAFSLLPVVHSSHITDKTNTDTFIVIFVPQPSYISNKRQILDTMLWTSLLALMALVDALPQEKRQGSTTMLRFGCAQVVIDRLDPLVNPGVVPSPHVHQIVGGNAFNASMTTGDVSGGASCTTCAFSDDFSNYWTANLYFKARNGTYKRVPQLGAACVP